MEKATTISIALNSIPQATVYPADLKMFKFKNAGIAAQMENVWGEKLFLYPNPQDKLDDYEKMFDALKQVTNNLVMQFNSTEKHVVPLYRINKAYANTCARRLEVEVQGVFPKQWFEYLDTKVLNEDYNKLMDLMNSGNVAMQFNSIERNIVPVSRIKKVFVNVENRRIEVDLEGVFGKQWFEYYDMKVLNEDYNKLMDLMRGGHR